MTGLDLEKDTLLEIAVVVTEGDTLQKVAATESIVISATEVPAMLCLLLAPCSLLLAPSLCLTP